MPSIKKRDKDPAAKEMLDHIDDFGIRLQPKANTLSLKKIYSKATPYI